MAITFTYTDKGIDTLTKRLNKELSDLSKPLKDVAVYMKEEVMENFEQEGRPKGWAALADSTIEKKKKAKGVSGQILEFHGKLKQSINLRSDKSEASVFSGVFYGVYHQTGTRKMPQRAFMPYSDSDGIPPFDTKGIENIKDILLEHLTRACD